MIKSIGTHIKVANFAKSKAFYLALGFQPVFAYGPGTDIPEDYSGLVFEHGGCKLEIASGHRAVKPQVFNEHVSSSKISLMVYVDSLSEIIKRAQQAHIPISVGPRHYYWGTLELVIKDPDGTVLVFIAPFSAPEAARLHADESFATHP